MADSTRISRSEARRRKILENSESRLQKVSGQVPTAAPERSDDSPLKLSEEVKESSSYKEDSAADVQPSNDSTQASTSPGTLFKEKQEAACEPLLPSECPLGNDADQSADILTNLTPSTEDRKSLEPSGGWNLLRSLLISVLGVITYVLILRNDLTSALGPFISLELVLFTLWPINTLELPPLFSVPVQLLKLYSQAVGEVVEGLAKAFTAVFKDFAFYVFSFVMACVCYEQLV